MLRQLDQQYSLISRAQQSKQLRVEQHIALLQGIDECSEVRIYKQLKC